MLQKTPIGNGEYSYKVFASLRVSFRYGMDQRDQFWPFLAILAGFGVSMTLISLKEGQLSSRIVSFALWIASTKIQQLRSTQKSRNFISGEGWGFQVFLYETGLNHYIGNLFMPNDVFLPIL